MFLRNDMLHRLDSALVRCLLASWMLLAPWIPASANSLAKASAEEGLPEFTSQAISAFETIPVQDGGRVKPLDTLAGFKLLKMNGKRVVRLEDGSKIKQTEWMLTCLFFPEVAAEIPFFLVRNKDALTAVGLSFPDKKRSDRYTYKDLMEGRSKLFERASKVAAIEAPKRSPLESQILQVATNMREFEDLTQVLDFARQTYPIEGERLQGIFGERDDAPLSEVLQAAPEVTELVRELASQSEGMGDEVGIQRLMLQLEGYMQAGGNLALFPPDTDPELQETWITPAELILHAFDPDQVIPVDKKVSMVAVLEKLHDARDNPEEFAGLADKLNEGLVAIAKDRGEYKHIPLEVSFYKGKYFLYGKVFFGLAFLLLAFSWMKPARWLDRGVVGSVTVGLVLTVVGITLRSIIRERPPISTLYETILFITASAVLVCLIIEYWNRQKVALFLAPILGLGGLFMAMKYELKEAVTSGDTMPSLVAVLDTNFWLATHVTIVTMGYAAGLLAGALAHVWIFGKILGVKRGDTKFYKSITRMTYGVLCFGLLFSVVGTILGGIWANYSWGRFWGWDPKENGALLICLWELLILHARLGGYIRDFGIAVMSVIGGVVVAFSWWGVNLLGVGLHSYGFTDGVQFWLTCFYLAQAAVVVVAFGWWLLQRMQDQNKPSAGAPA